MKKDEVLRELTSKEVTEYIIELNKKQGRNAVQQFGKGNCHLLTRFKQNFNIDISVKIVYTYL